MNILMALSQLEVTGAEVYATTVGNELTRRGHQVFYVSDTLTKPTLGQVFKLRFNKRSILRRFWHVFYLVYLIKKYHIQLVHAHSRASGWSSYVACKLTGTPMITTVHGRQPVHASRKAFHALGFRAVAVCEDIASQIIDNLGVDPAIVQVLRNGIETDKFQPVPAPDNAKPVIAIIGRLSGPKGELCYRLLDEVLDLDACQVKVVSGSQVPERFVRFRDRVDFVGYVEDVPALMAQCDLVIGAGRVAMEALLCGRPAFAIGEAKAIGLVTGQNLDEALASNFGDIGPRDLAIDFAALKTQIAPALASGSVSDVIRLRIQVEYGLAGVVSSLEVIYQDAVVETLRREMPVIMYHRFIEHESEKGVHGTWMPIAMFEKHLRLMKWLGYETLTFRDLADKGFIHRLQYGKRYLMITADDGYQDNLTRMLPLLEKYGYKAVVYVVTGEGYNRWDVEQTSNPDTRVDLMNGEQLKALVASGHVEIGGHTLTHPRLSKLAPEQQAHEIQENKRQLETLLGHPLLSFAYPYGDMDESAKAQAMAAGYRFAVATNSGPRAMHQDPFRIRRIAIFPRTDVFGLWRKIRGNYVFRKS
ncbi:polysaccharide deacetylase family protein [Aeromonas dhakensis]|uniref:polysaccharide deacetylase family protein n=1 Tax=Aeromonas TaxID=642 RepID=UPI0005B7EF99|nr:MULTISPECIES: polysaccharide deacetylase family protein [Aeromonas]MDD9307991.1 polysaccharide deacetylase family protein [Aeromonas hydrophila]ELM3751260.1 polysaccharide deacetylase family protein [Aeromonas dhakensis]MBL0463105.1 polysaccharide deacetylase family protein [Aeromonas dhakensis]MBL0604130.1 polysaccharide deacetylase family protein [Aeromonas dhakensis]MBL0620764.1 polysaccharide deacetylase family protein [Aeromonas dhakensis]